MTAIAFGPVRRCLPAVAVVLVLAGCGQAPADHDAGGGDAPAPAAEGGGATLGDPTMQITVDLNGAIALHGQKTSHGAFTPTGQQITSCADYAKGAPDASGHPIIQLPTVLTTSAAPLAGHQVLFTNQLERYHGPGTYDRDSLTGQGGGATVEIDNQAYALASDSTASTAINPDGSGRLTFAGFQADGAGILNGTVSWTCAD